MGEKAPSLRERALQALAENELRQAASDARITESRVQDMLRDYAGAFGYGGKPDGWTVIQVPGAYYGRDAFAFRVMTGDLTLWWGSLQIGGYCTGTGFFLISACPKCGREIPGETIHSLAQLGEQIRPGNVWMPRAHECVESVKVLSVAEQLVEALDAWRAAQSDE